MLINVTTETFNVPDGTYRAVIKNFCGYNDDTKALLKLELESGEVFVKTYDASEVGKYPWNVVFNALNTKDTNDLIGHKVEVEIQNNTSKKNNFEFSNIKRIRLIDE